jgi:hypothetical protein
MGIALDNLHEGLLALANLQDYLKQSCGAINPKTGRPDRVGFGLEIWPECRRELNRKPTVTDVLEYYTLYRPSFDKYPALRVGWDRTELNIGAVTPSYGLAMDVAWKLNQRAIFDIKQGKEICVGGNGNLIVVLNYTLEQRLQDLGL